MGPAPIVDSLEVTAREASLALRIRTALQEAGAWVYTTHGEPMGRVGAPDMLVCYRGRFIAVEVKRANGVPTAAQNRQLAHIRTAGGQAIVARSVEDALAVLEVGHEATSACRCSARR